MSQTQIFPLIKTRHSFSETKSPSESVPSSKSDTYSRSDMNIIRTNDFPSVIDSGCVNRHGLSVRKDSSEEYYEKYEHDDVPVKDSSCFSSVSRTTKELTNSDLDKLEFRVFKNMSKELQTDESSTDTYEYNIQLFKTTVQQILDNFYNNARDFEIYKKKFHEILSKNKENIINEMEDFIKEMIQNIASSESCTSSEKNATKLPCNKIGSEDTCVDDPRTFPYDGTQCQLNTRETIEAYKNENYLTDSTFDDEIAKMNQGENKEKPCNIYLLKGNPRVEIKIDSRNLLSEINIKNKSPEEVDQIASADNVKSVAAKRLQMTKYMKSIERQSSDKIIPVKISYAKNNIHSEDYPDETDENNKSFIFKICNFLCKKLRKTSFG